MNIGKLLARLNAKTVRFNVGSGGMPSLTPEMIAGAIAFVEPGLGRELLCYVWWPAGAALTDRQLRELLLAAHMTEWVAREDAYQTARTRLAVQAHSGALRWATREFAAASRTRWPAILRNGSHDAMQPVETYAKVRQAVLEELRLGDFCTVCEGSGARVLRATPSVCTECEGTGHRKTSDRWRAKACEVRLSTYQTTWARVYEWTLAHCRTAMSNAEGQFARAVA